MKRLSSNCILLAVQILVRLQSGILGIPKLTGLLVGHVVAGLRAVSALRVVCRCHDRVSPSGMRAAQLEIPSLFG
jgi:hypothetical protein